MVYRESVVPVPMILTASQVLNDFNINMETIGNSNTKSDEKNMAGFFSIGQQFGKIAVEAGLRYEHVNFKYTEDGQLKEGKSKTYNNIFPSLSISTRDRKDAMGFELHQQDAASVIR